MHGRAARRGTALTPERDQWAEDAPLTHYTHGGYTWERSLSSIHFASHVASLDGAEERQLRFWLGVEW